MVKTHLSFLPIVFIAIASGTSFRVQSLQCLPSSLVVLTYTHRAVSMATCSIPNSKKKGCVPCEGLDPSAVLSVEEVTKRLETTLPLWTLTPSTDDSTCNSIRKISKSFVAKNFQAALDAVNAMGAIAEVEGHHPDFHLTSYRNVQVDLFTHSLGGITENDLILAELLDQVPVEYSPKWLRENPRAGLPKSQDFGTHQG